MQTLYRILWSLAILLIIVTTVIFSLGFILLAAVVIGLLGIYRHYIMKRRSRHFNTRPRTNNRLEIIDLKAEVINETIQAKKPDEFK